MKPAIDLAASELEYAARFVSESGRSAAHVRNALGHLIRHVRVLEAHEPARDEPADGDGEGRAYDELPWLRAVVAEAVSWAVDRETCLFCGFRGNTKPRHDDCALVDQGFIDAAGYATADGSRLLALAVRRPKEPSPPEPTAFDRYVSERRKDPEFEREYQAAKAELAGSPEPPATGESEEEQLRYFHQHYLAGWIDKDWADLDEEEREDVEKTFRFARDIGVKAERARIDKDTDETIALLRQVADERKHELEILKIHHGNAQREVDRLRPAHAEAESRASTAESDRDRALTMAGELEGKVAAWEPVVVAVGMATSPSDQAPLAIACSRFDALPPEFRPSKETT